MKLNLEFLLRLAALVQLGVVFLNLFLVRIMKWRRDLHARPVLIRKVFQIQIYFISITLAIFGTVTWRFAREIASALWTLSPFVDPKWKPRSPIARD